MCPREDLNLYGRAAIRPWSERVCQFRHEGRVRILPKVIISYYILSLSGIDMQVLKHPFCFYMPFIDSRKAFCGCVYDAERYTLEIFWGCIEIARVIEE